MQFKWCCSNIDFSKSSNFKNHKNLMTNIMLKDISSDNSCLVAAESILSRMLGESNAVTIARINVLDLEQEHLIADLKQFNNDYYLNQEL